MKSGLSLIAVHLFNSLRALETIELPGKKCFGESLGNTCSALSGEEHECLLVTLRETLQWLLLQAVLTVNFAC